MSKTLWENNWLAIRESQGYSYLHEKTRLGTVAVLPYHFKSNGEMVVLSRVEVCPAHSDRHEMNCITGGVAHSCTPEEAAVEELLEEAGYSVKESDLLFVGKFFVSKQTDTVVYCYAVEIKDTDVRSEACGDGSLLEKSACTTWVGHDLAQHVKDINFSYIYCRLLLSIQLSKLSNHGLL